uniref:E3 ubiquitin-protein ligase TRIM47-like n=1 Tax=Gasterosteus aculeatus aculeatus TaxID=481459 RepID=UPI001A99786F|nr:E3 ubiquitin-protein ligase TRIM47-like [Gasterosteus aculeatus aculeatus]
MSDPPQCCICLEEFARPASLPCGHRFCLSCIGEYWRIHGACRCPLCKAFFPTRPPLNAAQTHGAGVPTEEEEAPPLKAGEVPCDLCPAKRRAVKSCLACLASYCAAHLEPHYQREDLGRHLLINVVKNLEDPACGLHGKQLQKFCRSDRTCICAMCAQTEHRGHHIVSIHREATKMKVKLKWRKTKLQQAIQERLSEVEKTELSAGLVGTGPSEERAPSKELIARLGEEISELRSRSAALDQISRGEDDLRFLQTFLHTSSWTDAFDLK